MLRVIEGMILSGQLPAPIYRTAVEYVIGGAQFQKTPWPAVARMVQLVHYTRNSVDATDPISTSARSDSAFDGLVDRIAKDRYLVVLAHGSLPSIATDPALFGLRGSAESEAERAVKSASTFDKAKGIASIAGIDAMQVAAVNLGFVQQPQVVFERVMGALESCPQLVRMRFRSFAAMLVSHCRDNYYDFRTRDDPDARYLDAGAVFDEVSETAAS